MPKYLDLDGLTYYFDKTTPFVTPEMFGAKGDGLTDDTLAFQAALDSGKDVRLWGKTYRINSTLTVTKRLAFTGDAQNTIIEYGGSSGYLFDVQTNYRIKPIIERCTFKDVSGGNNASFLHNHVSAWGASVVVQDCYILGFNKNVFLFETAFNSVLKDLSIFSNGKIQYKPWDATRPLADTFSNENLMQSVYYSGYPNYTDTIMELDNVRGLLLDGCSLEKANKGLNMTNHCQNVVLDNCWFENVSALYTSDANSAEPSVNNYKSVNVSKLDGNSTDIDMWEQSRGTKFLRFLGSGNDTYRGMYIGTDEYRFDKVQLYNPNNEDYKTVYERTTKKIDSYVPYNHRRVFKQNSTTIAYDLHSVLGTSATACFFEVTGYIGFDDWTYRVVKWDILMPDHNIFRVPKPRVIYAETWGTGLSATETGAVSDGVFTLTTSTTYKFAYLMVDFKPLGNHLNATNV